MFPNFKPIYPNMKISRSSALCQWDECALWADRCWTEPFGICAYRALVTSWNQKEFNGGQASHLCLQLIFSTDSHGALACPCPKSQVSGWHTPISNPEQAEVPSKRDLAHEGHTWLGVELKQNLHVASRLLVAPTPVRAMWMHEAPWSLTLGRHPTLLWPLKVFCLHILECYLCDRDHGI